MEIVIKYSIKNIDPNWDDLRNSVYQKINFLDHAEKFNPCKQRYYLGYINDILHVGAVVYELKVNLLTFASFHFKLPMKIIGIPASVDAKGLIGDSKFYTELISFILKKESGLTLCLNYDYSLKIKRIIEMHTLPTLIYNSCISSWKEYLKTLRHSYRRRILKAEKKFQTVHVKKNECSQFTDEHYELYLNIINRTKTKLEILTQDFFSNLPSEYILYSCYSKKELIAWHITVFDKGIYYFLFGGLNYTLRDKYDAYYNNLIQIIKEGVNLKSDLINLGQTAEISKNRLGAKIINKKMFLFHKNIFIRSIFRLCKNLLSYRIKSNEINIYNKNLQI